MKEYHYYYNNFMNISYNCYNRLLYIFLNNVYKIIINNICDDKFDDIIWGKSNSFINYIFDGLKLVYFYFKYFWIKKLNEFKNYKWKLLKNRYKMNCYVEKGWLKKMYIMIEYKIDMIEIKFDRYRWY